MEFLPAAIVHGDFTINNVIFHPTEVRENLMESSSLSPSFLPCIYLPLPSFHLPSPPSTSQPRVLAVLDWELSTIGHPSADVAYFALFSTPSIGLLAAGTMLYTYRVSHTFNIYGCFVYFGVLFLSSS